MPAVLPPRRSATGSGPSPRNHRGWGAPAFASLCVSLCLIVVAAGEAIAGPAAREAAPPDPVKVGKAVGRDVARRWCAGEEPDQAIEQAMNAYLISRKVDPDKLPEALGAAIGEEIAVEAFDQAFSRCRQRARQVLRIILD